MKRSFQIESDRLEAINAFLTEGLNPALDPLLEVVKRYGGADRINDLARKNGALSSLLERLKKKNSAYAAQLDWLMEQRNARRFVSMPDYVARIVATGAAKTRADRAPVIDSSYQVTLEISALQFFPWLISQARQTIEKQELMPGRFIRVRAMKEQEEDGDLLAVVAAMKILGASWVESLDTKGTDGSNVHLGGPDTITGYFGGIGQPNRYPYRWIEEYLYYYTNYGVKQVLNINSGTVLAGYLLYKLGVDIEFKISVFMGNDNPLSVLWTLLTAKLFAREDGSTPLIGFNLSNSVDNWTLELTGRIRRELGFEENVRIEHHILESYRHIVRQPYDRLGELLEIAKTVRNISAKHEGGVPQTEQSRDYPSDILDYFLSKEEIEERSLMPALERNYLDKHAAVQRTATALLKEGIPVLAAPLLHHRD
ncbi:MAG: hypothetical protein JSV89_00975 [Spirochaetaceae bacterium]|nr:MAG: hypothetical protein JSV89_00975 [Spirochaetaceae bacterium]